VAFREEERIDRKEEKFGDATATEAGDVLRDKGHGSGGWAIEKEA
jgi:hypothetical protein